MNKTISSEMTAIYKFLFPAGWIGVFGVGTVSMLFSDDPEKWMFLAVFVPGSAFIAWLCYPLKYVAIDGADLVVSNFLRSDRVPVSQIGDVTENCWINIHPVCIHFRQPTAFGRKIVFMPTVRLFAFRSHPIVSELKTLAAKAS